MFASFVTVSGQVLTLYLLMSIGYMLKKMKKLSRETASEMTRLLLYVVTPCLIVDATQIPRTAENIYGIGFAALGAAIYFAIAIIGHRFFFRKTPPDTRAALQFGSVYTNSGFMGIPLARAVLGDEAALYAVVFLVMMSVIHWTQGAKLMDKSGRISVKNALVNPGTVGFVAGIALFAFGVPLPSPIGNALRFAADLNTPLAMVIIGSMMADADLLKLFRVRELYLAAALKLVLFPALATLALIFLPLDIPPVIFCAVVILSATPSAGVTAMFAQRYKRDTVTASRCVSFVTLLSVVTLPLFAAVAQLLSNSAA